MSFKVGSDRFRLRGNGYALGLTGMVRPTHCHLTQVARNLGFLRATRVVFQELANFANRLS